MSARFFTSERSVWVFGGPPAPLRIALIAWVLIFYPALVAGVMLGLLGGSLALGVLSSEKEAGNAHGRAAGVSPVPPHVEGRTARAVAAGREAGDLIESGSIPHVVSVAARATPIARGVVGGTAEAAIRAAAARYGVDADRLVAVARCESGPAIDVNAIGDGGLALGPMQFHARTFVWLSEVSGLGYELRDVADPEAQFDVAAWAFANGWGHWWTCDGR